MKLQRDASERVRGEGDGVRRQQRTAADLECVGSCVHSHIGTRKKDGEGGIGRES